MPRRGRAAAGDLGAGVHRRRAGDAATRRGLRGRPRGRRVRFLRRDAGIRVRHQRAARRRDRALVAHARRPRIVAERRARTPAEGIPARHARRDRRAAHLLDVRSADGEERVLQPEPVGRQGRRLCARHVWKDDEPAAPRDADGPVDRGAFREALGDRSHTSAGTRNAGAHRVSAAGRLYRLAGRPVAGYGADRDPGRHRRRARTVARVGANVALAVRDHFQWALGARLRRPASTAIRRRTDHSTSWRANVRPPPASPRSAAPQGSKGRPSA